MLQGDELVLEAFAGRETEHTHIPVGRGVCGTAVATGQDQNVPDVAAVGNYLACNLETRSELVVLIRRGARILGQLDVDSDVPAGFTTNVWDRERAGNNEIRLVGPVPAKLPVGVDFIARPFGEPLLFRIAAAYEAATKNRRPPEDFGPLDK